MMDGSQCGDVAVAAGETGKPTVTEAPVEKVAEMHTMEDHAAEKSKGECGNNGGTLSSVVALPEQPGLTLEMKEEIEMIVRIHLQPFQREVAYLGEQNLKLEKRMVELENEKLVVLQKLEMLEKQNQGLQMKSVTVEVKAAIQETSTSMQTDDVVVEESTVDVRAAVQATSTSMQTDDVVVEESTVEVRVAVQEISTSMQTDYVVVEERQETIGGEQETQVEEGAVGGTEEPEVETAENQTQTLLAMGNNKDPLLLAKTMEAFFDKHVAYKDELMKENSKLVNDFIAELKDFLTENMRDLPLSVPGIQKQGSAAEGLKVGAPDEFDFAIRLQFKKKTGTFIPIEGRSIGPTLPDPEKSAGYWKIEFSPQKPNEEIKDDWKQFTEMWPGANKVVISPRKVVRRIQSAIDKMLLDETRSAKWEWRKKIQDMKRTAKGNPALTVGLTKLDGSVIDVDVSPCIIMLINQEEKHFVPKRHPKLQGKKFNEKEPYELLWMRTESQKEREFIRSIDKDGGDRRKCMRILKGALASKKTPFTQFHSSYVVKTAWLHVVTDNPGAHKWKEWEVLAMRLRDIMNKMEEAFKNRYLESKFLKKTENILARFDEPFLKSCAGFLQKLNNMLRAGQTTQFINALGLDGSGFIQT